MGGNKPIGIFDSGIGGLTVFREIVRSLPEEDVVYFGDTARVPYGTKSKATISRFSRENTEFLLRIGVKLIVVACNTASSLALTSLRRRFPVPIIGVIEPGVSAAAGVTRNKRIGVIGTSSTIVSGVYQRKLKKIEPGLRVVARPCPLFVPLVEEGWTKHRVSYEVAREYLGPLRECGIDTLILGCTHYPLLKPILKEIMGDSVFLVDSAEETARVTRKVLADKKLRSRRKSRQANYRFYVSDEPERFVRVGRMFLRTKLRSVKRVSPHV